MDFLATHSLAQWYSEIERDHCGYCKNSSGSIVYGMTTENLSVEEYKNLIDRGWRRSGKYCYKPTMDKTCCPQYTIKCDSENFTMNKSHKKIIKKFNKFLSDGIYVKNESPHEDQEQIENGCEVIGKNKQNIDLKQMQITSVDIASTMSESARRRIGDSYGSSQKSVNSTNNVVKSADSGDNVNCEQTKTKKPVAAGTGPDPNKPPCKKAKVLRLERKQRKLSTGSSFNDRTNPSQNSLDKLLENISPTSKLKLKLAIIPTRGTEWDKVQKVEYELYKKYQIVVHNDRPEKLSVNGFLRFLVHSPLKHEPFPDGVEGPGYGSFHQQYWIDDKLIAVGVIDILPGCVSSVYFFYDPDYRNLTLGTYGSLREIQLVNELHSKIPDLKYYYMGYYIHSCPKMRYKGKLKPSYLLCPETYSWQPIGTCLPKLDLSKYSRLNDDPNAEDDNLCSNHDIGCINIVINHKLYDVHNYLTRFEADESVFCTIGQLVGKKAVRRMIFLID